MIHRLRDKVGVIIGAAIIAFILPMLLANIDHPSIAAKIIMITLLLAGVFFIFESAYKKNYSTQTFVNLFLGSGLGLLIYGSLPFSHEYWGAISSGLGTEFLGICATVWGIDRLNRIAEQKKEKRLEQELTELSNRIAELYEYIVRRETL